MQLPFTHVKRTDGENEQNLHMSHLFQYVSVYALCDETLKETTDNLELALEAAKASRCSVVVDQGGEMLFVAYPSGRFSVCLPWKTYEPLREKT